MFERVTLGYKYFTNIKLNKTTNLNFSGRYVSPRSDFFYVFEGFHTFNIGFNKRFLDDKLNLRIRLNDVFNTRQYNSTRTYSSYEVINNVKPKTRFLGVQLIYNFSKSSKVLKKKNKSKNDNRRRL